MRLSTPDAAATASVMGALSFALAAAAPWGHMVFSGFYPHFTPIVSLVIDAFLSLLWLSSALTLVFRLRGAGLVPLLGVFFLFTYGAFTCLSVSAIGLPFIVATPMVAALVWSGLRMSHGPYGIPAHR